jgi:hypothetical protein
MLFLSLPSVIEAKSLFLQDNISEWGGAVYQEGAEENTANAQKWGKHMGDNTMYFLTDALLGAGNPDLVQGFNTSAVGMMAQGIDTMMDNQPASTTYYAYDLMNNAGFIESAHAQGIGYSGLSPILDLWRAFRNISYAILIVILVAIGFMIMFRMQLGSQTAITIQNALPNIILTLITITFSYAIAGFFIDMMYFIMYLSIGIIADAGGLLSDDLSVFELNERYTNANISTLFGLVYDWDKVLSLPKAIFGLVFTGGVPGLGVAGIGTAAGAALLGGPAGLVTGGLVVGIGALALGAIPILIIALGLFFATLRILVLLVGAYINIMLSVIFSPIILLFGAIPGNPAFSNWIRGLLSNLSVFPTTAIIFLVSRGILEKISAYGESDNLWAPPFVAGARSSGDIMIALIGVGMAMIAPTFVTTVKGWFGAPSSVPIGPSVILAPTQQLASRAQQGVSWWQVQGGKEFTQGLTSKFKSTDGSKP